MSDKKIFQLIEVEDFHGAYAELRDRLTEGPLNVALLDLSRKLSAGIRRRCMDLSTSRATEGSLEVIRLEELLLEVIKINKEGIYG